MKIDKMDVKERFSELRLLTALAPHMSSPQDLGPSLARFCAELFSADICSVWIVVRDTYMGDKLKLIGYQGFRGEIPSWEEPPSYDLPWDANSDSDINGLTAWVAVRNKYFVADSYQVLSSHPSYRGQLADKIFAGSADKRFLCLRAVPLVADKKVIGVLKLENAVDSKLIWSEDDFSVLINLVVPAASVLFASAVERNESDLKRQKALTDIAGQFLQPILNPNHLYQTIVDTAAAVLQAEICSLWIVDNLRKTLYLGAAHGVKILKDCPPSEGSESPTYELDWAEKNDEKIEGMTAWVAVRSRPYTADSYAELEHHPAHRGSWDNSQFSGEPQNFFRCLHAEPLVCSGRTIGVFKVENRMGLHAFSESDKSTCRLLAQFLALALEQTGRLGELAFDYFHLLKEPIANVLQAYEMFRSDLPRAIDEISPRLQQWLDIFQRNLVNLNAWTTIAYALGQGRRDRGPKKDVPILDIYREAVRRLEFAPEQKVFQEGPGSERYCLPLTENQQKMVLVVLFNIMHNSLKSVADISTQGSIELSVHSDTDDRLHLVIKDNGAGISGCDQPHVFEPGFSKGHPKFPDALGLGLTTVARLVADLHWQRRLLSTPGKGTTFSLIVPPGKWKERR